MPEPTVLDYVKAKLTFWRPSNLHIPPADDSEFLEPAEDARPGVGRGFLSGGSGTGIDSRTQPGEFLGDSGDWLPTLERDSQAASMVEEAPEELPRLSQGTFPWRISLALILALSAQIWLNPPSRSVMAGVIAYLLAAGFAIWGLISSEWVLAPLPPDERSTRSVWVRLTPLVGGLVMAAATFIVFASGVFTPFTIIVWLATVALFIAAFWIPGENSWGVRARRFMASRRWHITITPWTFLAIAAILIVIFFRVYQINQVPPEMVSDHAEKLLDVNDVLNGKTAVYFPRNTGREFFQFYLTAAVILMFKTGVSFLSLKIGTIFMGLMTLPFIYLIGKEFGNKRVGLLALFFAGIAYWPNVISRIALRFTLFPAFVAPTLYFLLRGLRRSSRNDFILSGIFLGLGLHGYTSFRITPLVVVAAVLLYLLHRQSKGARLEAVYGLLILAVVSFAVFLPLARYAVDNPQMFAYRTLTRVGTLEQPLPGPVIPIFLGNLWNALTLFFWQDGDVWVHSVPNRPALDTVTAALFFLGIVLVAVRYLQRRNWSDLFLVVSIPLLMLPSILSLAFPNENPSLNRTAGAFVPVFIVVALGLEAVFIGLKEKLGGRGGAVTAFAVLALLVVFSMQDNYQLVFDQYYRQFRSASWNTSEMGQVLQGFARSVGSPDREWVVAYPYWVDTRLVGINAGYPAWDTAISRDNIPATRLSPGVKLFLVNPQDQDGLQVLQSTYPHGLSWTYASQVAGKDFLVFMTPE
ncbi:MAG: glycosyltransferase family 39 protein [Anaerolineaceae bacterium]|nr:glycosyltransferase family 39 protein [Anaerolineaceae bacterium]